MQNLSTAALPSFVLVVADHDRLVRAGLPVGHLHGELALEGGEDVLVSGFRHYICSVCISNVSKVEDDVYLNLPALHELFAK